MKADVVVIGAGCAGLSAAVRLADQGLKVVVVEESPRLGGRATSFADRETGERVDNGQHVLFGCYRETYAFLARLGTASLAPLERRLELCMTDADGRGSVLSCPAWPPPWHLVAGVMKWRELPVRDRLSAVGLAGLLRQVRRSGAEAVAAQVPASQTVSAWLAARGQSAKLCAWLWHPLAIAALNQSPDEAAARPFVRVLGELFGPRAADSAVGLPSVPLDELYAVPAVRAIEARGGIVLTRSPGKIGLDPGGLIGRVQAGETTVETTRVVSAVPWHALGRIWEGAAPPAVADAVSCAEMMGASPIVTVNLWFERPMMTARFVGLIGTTMQWAFDKSAIFGETAGHISVVSSGASRLTSLDNAAVTAIAEREIRRALAVNGANRLLRSVVVREHRATFSLAPGGPGRPGTSTGLPGFFLAGDWIDTGLPATIESAVVSGHRAAAAVAAAGLTRAMIDSR